MCRHSQCDLHTTTDVLAVPYLAAKCTEPFSPADPATGKASSAKCCTNDITLAEFKRLRGKMDAADKAATTVEGYMGGTANWRTDLYATSGTVLTHAESIRLFERLGAKFTPELKSPSVEMPFDGDYTQEAYAQQMIDEYKAAGVPASDVFAQSFNLDDVLYWIKNEPAFGNQAVYLDGRYGDKTFDHADPATWNPDMKALAAAGVRIVAPSMWMLVGLDANRKIVPSVYTKEAKGAGLDVITWTLERSGPLDGGGWYFQMVKDGLRGDGSYYELLDVLAKDVGIKGIFSDWPATVTYYANCMGLK